MTTLQLNYNSKNLPNNYIKKDLSSQIPKWIGNDGTIDGNLLSTNYWWKDNLTNPYVDVFISNNSFHTYTQYGQDVPIYATAKMFHFRYDITNEVINDDMSIDADVAVWADAVVSRKSSYSKNGYNITNKLTVAGKVIATYTGNSSDEYTNTSNKGLKVIVYTGKIHVAPQAYAESIEMKFSTHYTNGEFPDLTIAVGATLYNPLSPLYTPMKLKVNGQWITLNDTAKKNKRKKNGSWVDIAQENLSSQNAVNTGHNRRKKGGQYQQMPLPK